MKQNIERIINKACELWGVSRDSVMGRSRVQPIPFARIMIAKCLRDFYGMSFSQIGIVLNRNHSSVMHYLKVYESEYLYNKDFHDIANIMKILDLDIKNNLQQELEDEFNEIHG